jgi:hypothetical protein
VHVPTKYDYRFLTPKRDAIVDLLKRLYLIENKANCPVYHITSKDLRDFTTTEKDMDKKISRIPTNQYLSTGEDLLVIDTP